jgi:hypothetical protein
MNDHVRRPLAALFLLGALVPAPLFAQTWTAPGSGAWTTGSNWSGGSAPTTSTSSNIVINNTAASADQVVTLDVGASGFSVGTLSLLSTNAGGYLNRLELTSSGTTTTSGMYVSELFNPGTAGLILGSASGTVELRLTPSVAGAFVVLTTYSGSPGVTLNAGGLLTLNGNGFSNTNPNVNAPVIISGGSLSILASSSAGGVSGAGNGITLSSGSITFDNNAAATTGRLAVAGNLTATGGGITGNHFAGSANIIELSGAANTIGAGVTINNSGNLTFSFRGSAAQSLGSAVDLPHLTVRNGQVNTIAVTSAGKNVGQITIQNTASTTFKMGSDMNTAYNPIVSGSANSTIDLDGRTLNITAGSQWSVGTQSTKIISASPGTVRAHSYNFGNASVGANVTVEANGAGATSTALSTATFAATSVLRFIGNSALGNVSGLVVTTPGTAIGTLQVGDGIGSTYVQIQNNVLTMQGGLIIGGGSTLDLNGRVHNVAGPLQGSGTVRLFNASGVNLNGTGGISAGNGIGNVGTLTLSGTSTTQALTLNNNSVSYFDLSADSTNDVFNAAGNNLTLDGTLQITLVGGYTPTSVGQTWTLFTNLGAGTTGGFDSVLGAAGETYSFGVSGGNGILTLTTAVPEPSALAILGAGLLGAFTGLRRRRA